jgi:hypothetical protein
VDFGDARTSKNLSKGCVQGYVCGPTFWNLILDELIEIGIPDGCYIQALADDVLLTVTGKKASDVGAAANQALDSISIWGRSAKLTFSPIKTEAIHFTPASKDTSLSMDGTEIPMSPQLKIIGIILDSNLNFIARAKYIVQKRPRSSRICASLCVVDGESSRQMLRLSTSTLSSPSLLMRLESGDVQQNECPSNVYFGASRGPLPSEPSEPSTLSL